MLGLPSAININFLNNQDWVWGIGLLLCGLFYALAVYKFGVDRFRLQIINSCSDIQVGKWFNYAVLFFPALLTVVVGWWFYQSIGWYPDSWWNPFLTESLGTVVFQVGLTIGVFYLANNWLGNWVTPEKLMNEGKFIKAIEEV